MDIFREVCQTSEVDIGSGKGTPSRLLDGLTVPSIIQSPGSVPPFQMVMRCARCLSQERNEILRGLVREEY